MSAQVTPNRTPHPAHFDYTDFSTMHRIKHFPSIVGRYANLPPQTSLKICIPGIPFESRLFGETGGIFYNMKLYCNTQYYRYINPHSMMTTPVPTPLPVVQLRSARKSRSIRITRILTSARTIRLDSCTAIRYARSVARGGPGDRIRKARKGAVGGQPEHSRLVTQRRWCLRIIR